MRLSRFLDRKVQDRRHTKDMHQPYQTVIPCLRFNSATIGTTGGLISAGAQQYQKIDTSGFLHQSLVLPEIDRLYRLHRQYIPHRHSGIHNAALLPKTLRKYEASTASPVSSNSSLRTASSVVSPSSMAPPMAPASIIRSLEHQHLLRRVIQNNACTA